MEQSYEKAVRLIDQVNKKDPQMDEYAGEENPKEYLYSLRMVAMLQKFRPDADEAHLLAARCLHLFRWEVPRSSYPHGKIGYLKWRTYLYTYQAEKAVALLESAGYGGDVLDRVFAMVAKKNQKSNKDAQLIEDVSCLVFLQYYAESFAVRYADDLPKLMDIVKKTWNKMSDGGRNFAIHLDLSADLLHLLQKAMC